MSPLRAFAVLAFCLGAALPARAQDAIDRLIGRPIAAIRFEVEGRAVESADLASLVPLRPGDPLRLDAIRDGELHLVNARRYDTVRVTFTEGPAGIELVFHLTPQHPIDRVEFRGENTGLSSGELERLVRDRYGGLPAREAPASVAAALVLLLRDEGFPEARVEPEVIVTHDPDRATLVLTVAAGSRPLIARTEVRGTSPLSRDQIIARTGTAPSHPFRLAELERRLTDLEDDLRRSGYYSAVAILPANPVPVDGGLAVSLLVEAGPRVTLTWDGPKPPGDEEAFVPMRRQRSVDEDLLEDSDRRVAEYWRRRGYKDVRVTHSRSLSGEQLTITMHTELGRRHVVEAVRVTGSSRPEVEVQETLDIRRGDPYDEAKLQTGIGRLIIGYRRLGYHRVQVTARDIEEVAEAQTPTVVRVIVPVEIVEGPRALVGDVQLAGVHAARQAGVRRLLATVRGAPYVRDTAVRDLNVIATYYRNLGFEDVEVKFEPATDAQGTSVNVTFSVTEGPQITVGTIHIVGNRSVSEEAIKDALTLREGQPLGEAARRESTRQLSLMGVFRSVQIEEEPRPSGDTVANLVVIVQELPPTSTTIGFGLEGGRVATETEPGVIEDRTFVSPRGSFEIGRRNLWGKNRRIDFFVRAAPRPSTKASEEFGFLEYRASGTYREPRAFRSETDITLGVASEQAARTGFNFLRQGASLQVVRRVSAQVTGSGRYGLEYTRLFDVNEAIIGEENEIIFQRLFGEVRLSTLSTAVIWDRRDDLVDPGRGTLMSAEAELAARRLGSQFGYSKLFLQTTVFHSLSAARRIVLAGRAQVGLAHGFPRTDLEGGQVVTRDDLPVSQRFFAGGSTTVRGFQIDRLGVPELLNPNGLSPGGHGVVILNAEIRARIGRLLGRNFGVTGFTDAGNVFPKASDIDFTRLRAAVGFGLRYDSPLGPVRFDVGFKTERQVIAGRRERGWEYHINIGEAF